jgi:hypothetical protein
LAVFLSQARLARAGNVSGMGHLLSDMPGVRVHGQKEGELKKSSAGGFNPSRGPMAACATTVEFTRDDWFAQRLRDSIDRRPYPIRRRYSASGAP